MRATEELRNDHAVLRHHLSVLDQVLPVAPADASAIESTLDVLQRTLGGHIEKEELLLGVLQERLKRRAVPAVEHLERHRAHAEALEALKGQFADPAQRVSGAVAESCVRWIQDVRESLAREEEWLFPLIDRLLVDGERSQSAVRLTRRAGRYYALEHARPALPHVPFTEDMTVNHILRRVPKAWAVLAAFAVDCEIDGPSAIEELAWRRGVDVDALLLALNQLAGVPTVPAPVPSLLWQSCDGMMLLDDHRRILALNPAMEKLLGRPVVEVVGRAECGALLCCQDRAGCSLVEHPERCPGLIAMHRMRPVRATEYSVETPSGVRRPVSVSYTPFQSKPGGPVWALAIIRSATLQKRRERVLARAGKSAGRAVVRPALAVERRRQPRVRMQIPVQVDDPAAREDQPRFRDGMLADISSSGAFAHFSLPAGSPLPAVNDIVHVSLSVPPSQHDVFPFSRISGAGRVVRVTAPPAQPPTSTRTRRIGLAWEYGPDVIQLSLKSA